MCFSSFASFSAGAGLISAGLICSYVALKRNSGYFPLTLMPLMTGIQQISEGIIWKNYELSGAIHTSYVAFLYLFFVWIFWPAWAGFSAGMLEPQKNRRRVLFGFSIFGLALGITLYVPYVWHPEWLHIEIVKHSIAYTNSCIIPDQYISRHMTYTVYLFLSCGPFLLSSHKSLQHFGATLAAFIPLVLVFFEYAYASVLCFFAALATIYVLRIVIWDTCKDPADEALEIIAEDAENHLAA